MSRPIRIMAVASAGGHWVQLMRLRPAWQGLDVSYVTTDAGLEMPLRKQSAEIDDRVSNFFTVVEANRWHKLRLLRQVTQILRIIAVLRPDVILTTGASPGYFALRIGRFLGARTIWIDSIANVEELSLSGKKAQPYADLWITQWEHLAQEDGPSFLGSVI